MTEKWIDVTERKPTPGDADAQHCVLGWHRYNGAVVTGWHNMSVYITHWMRLPDGPDTRDYEAVKEGAMA